MKCIFRNGKVFILMNDLVYYEKNVYCNYSLYNYIG